MMFDDTLISIHAPTRGATILCNHRGLVFGFQSTLPREERLSFPCNISFHLIFQSTLPREERQTMRKLTIAELNFNPRSHERSDPMVKKFLLMKMISIHAPTRGATCNSIRPLCIYEFQSTLPREERHHRCLFYVSNVLFQSTLPREERPCNSIRPLCIYEFQSTLPREERQVPESGTWQTSEISIHAPTRGATSTSNKTISSIIISIHAPTRGATARMRIYQLSF